VAELRTKTKRTLEISLPDDFHVHLRQPPLLQAYARRTADHFGRALIMPNTAPPIVTPEEVTAYRSQILAAIDAGASPPRESARFVPLMTFKVEPSMDRIAVAALKQVGAIAGKYYPKGVTTNSEEGIAEIETAMEAFAAMEAEGLVLCVHAEEPGAEILDRERAFLPYVARIAATFPHLRIVVEHLSSAAGVEAVLLLPENVAATVTVHHLLFTLDDMLGSHLNPHLYCKPVVKGMRDRAAIQRVVLEGNRRFFFGSDSAPHPRAAKEGATGAAGVYSMPVSLSLLAEFFERHGEIERLESFVSRFGALFYGFPPNEGSLRLEQSSWEVPAELDGVVPLCAGRQLSWRVAEVS